MKGTEHSKAVGFFCKGPKFGPWTAQYLVEQCQEEIYYNVHSEREASN